MLLCPLELLASCRLLHSHRSRRCSAAQTEHQSRHRAAVSPQSLPWQQTPLSTSPSALAGHHGSTQERRNIQYLPGNKHIVGCSPPQAWQQPTEPPLHCSTWGSPLLLPARSHPKPQLQQHHEQERVTAPAASDTALSPSACPGRSA